MHAEIARHVVLHFHAVHCQLTRSKKGSRDETTIPSHRQWVTYAKRVVTSTFETVQYRYL